MKKKPSDVDTRAKRIKLLLMDCDGVMTDGRIMLLENGDEQKTFNVRDGHGIVLFHRAGLKTGIISGRSSSFVPKRAWELGMPQEFVWQGCHNKIETFEDVLIRAQLEASEVAFIGDDLNDIPVFEIAGLSVCPADTFPYIKETVDLVTTAKGGRGVLREVADLVLAARGDFEKASGSV